MKLSNSEIQTFKECRRKWYLSYVRGLAPKVDKQYGAREVGTTVHAALERYYLGLLQNEIGHEDEILHDIFLARDERVAEYPDQADEITKDYELANIMVEGYFQWLEDEGADSDLELLAPEQEVEVFLGTIDDEPVYIVGKLDLRVRRLRDGVRLWMDHKTVGSLGEFDALGPIHEQFRTYSWLEWMLTDGDEWSDGGIINMLRKVKRTARANPPFYGRHEVRYNDHVMRTMTDRMTQTAKEILNLRRRLVEDGSVSDRLAYPSPTRDCSWKCEFLAICPMMDDGSDVESIIDSVYVTRDPYERYTTLER